MLWYVINYNQRELTNYIRKKMIGCFPISKVCFCFFNQFRMIDINVCSIVCIRHMATFFAKQGKVTYLTFPINHFSRLMRAISVLCPKIGAIHWKTRMPDWQCTYLKKFISHFAVSIITSYSLSWFVATTKMDNRGKCCYNFDTIQYTMVKLGTKRLVSIYHWIAFWIIL